MIARLIFTALAVPFVVVIYLNIETYAQSQGWDILLKGAMEGQVPNVVSWALQPWVGLTGLVIISLTLGLWLDALLRKFDANRPSRAERLKALGERSIRLASNIEVRLSIYDENELPSSIFAEIRAIYVEYANVGLPKLKTTAKLLRSTKLKLARSYLSHIGPLLRDGHYKEAKRVANKLLSNLREIERSEPQEPQDTPKEKRP